MKKDFISNLKNSSIFKTFSEKEIEIFLKSTKSLTKVFKKNSKILSEGDHTKNIFIILNGSISISREDYWGNTSVIAHFQELNMFAETFAFLENTPISVNVTATSDTRVLLINTDSIFSAEMENNSLKERFIKNLILVFASKNHYLSEKIESLSQRTIREKLLTYLRQVSIDCGSQEFTIPFNRQQLADYLAVDRSALSSQISKLKEEGILDADKNCFRLIHK